MGCSSTSAIASDDRFEINRKNYYEKEKEVMTLANKSGINFDSKHPEKAIEGIEIMNKLQKLSPELENEFKKLENEYSNQESTGKLGPYKELKKKLLDKAKDSYEMASQKVAFVTSRDNKNAENALGQIHK